MISRRHWHRPSSRGRPGMRTAALQRKRCREAHPQPRMACLLLAEEAQGAVRFGGKTPLLFAVLGYDEADQGAFEEENDGSDEADFEEELDEEDDGSDESYWSDGTVKSEPGFSESGGENPAIENPDGLATHPSEGGQIETGVPI